MPVEKLVALPDAVTAAEGAGIGIPAGTAYQALRSLGLVEGDVLLVHGGSGSVGQAAVQFAIAWGATVIATASPARHDQLRELGAVPVAYGDGLLDRVREAAPGGVTVALDCAGTDEAIEASLELVADRDRIATIVRGPDAASFGIRAFSGGSPPRSPSRSSRGEPRRWARPSSCWRPETSPSSSAPSCRSPRRRRPMSSWSPVPLRARSC